MLTRVLSLAALAAALTYSSLCQAQSLSVSPAWSEVHTVELGEDQEQLLSIADDTATYYSYSPFKIQWDAYGYPWQFSFNGAAMQSGGPYAPPTYWSTMVDGTSTPSLLIQVLGPGNPPSILAASGASDTNSTLDITIEELVDVSIPIQDIKDAARTGDNALADQVVNFMFGSEAADDFILQYGLTEQDVANRKAAAKTALRSGLYTLTDSGIDRAAGVSGAKARIHVGGGNPGVPRIQSFKSEIPSSLLNVGELEFNIGYGNASEAAELGLDGLQALIENGSTSYFMEAMEDFVFVEKAELIIPTYSQVNGFDVTGDVILAAEGLSLSRLEGVKLGGKVGVSKEGPNGTFNLQFECTKTYTTSTSQWEPWTPKVNVGASW